MVNNKLKLVKSATAFVIGAAVLTGSFAAAGSDTAFAKSSTSVKVSNGKLVYKSTGKVVKGYKTYNKALYKDGKKLTGLYKKTYYKAGKKATGTYKSVYYKAGKAFTGVTNKTYYKAGKKATGTYKNVYYKSGKAYTGVVNKTYYKAGKKATGLYKGVYYKTGKAATGIYKDQLYISGNLSKGLELYKEQLYKDGSLNKGLVVFKDQLYKDAVLNKGLVKFEDKFYFDAAIANGTYVDADNVERAIENGIEVGAKVKAVEAINVVELKVTFNRTVSKDSLSTTDFAVTETASPSTTVAVSDVQLSEDGKSAKLLLASAVPATGVDVAIAEGAILTKDFDKFAKSTTTEVRTAKDTTAPKLLSAIADGANIELTFDEPVNFGTSYTGAKIDQTVAATQPVNATKAGKYVYTIAASSALADGKHTVDLTNVTDFAGNTDVLISKEVTVTSDTSAAKVASIEANDSHTFIVKFSKAVALPTASNFEIKKGNLTLDSTNFTVTPTLVDEDGNAAVGSYSKYVKVTIADAVSNTVNPLYGKNENSVALSVKVSGYKDASTVLGTEFSGAVTLAKDLTVPAIKSEKLISSTATTIVLPFDKTLTSATNGTITVKQGNVLIAQSATVSDKNLTLTFGAGVLEAGKTYTITLAKGAVVSGGKSSEATTITYTVPTTAVSYTTTTPTLAVSKVNGKNIITLAYAGKVNDAAALASSYKLNGVALPAGTDVYFKNADKDEVIIELPASYEVGTENKAAKFTINADTVQYDSSVATDGDKFISGSATSSKAYETAITLKDNVAPVVSKVEYVKNAAGLAIGVKLTFSEAITDSTVDEANFVVTQGTTPVTYTVATGVAATADLVDDNILNLSFATPVTASGLVLSTNTDTTKLTLTDANGNILGAISAISVQ
ncbi:hypothetical protein [Viridibacillus arvi]|uniref:hypothetical protein n=1 Tax=Viridibacillus arvi TaxID=263475 RepID=UPI0038175DF7